MSLKQSVKTLNNSIKKFPYESWNRVLESAALNYKYHKLDDTTLATLYKKNRNGEILEQFLYRYPRQIFNCAEYSCSKFGDTKTDYNMDDLLSVVYIAIHEAIMSYDDRIIPNVPSLKACLFPLIRFRILRNVGNWHLNSNQIRVPRYQLKKNQSNRSEYREEAEKYMKMCNPVNITHTDDDSEYSNPHSIQESDIKYQDGLDPFDNPLEHTSLNEWLINLHKLLNPGDFKDLTSSLGLDISDYNLDKKEESNESNSCMLAKDYFKAAKRLSLSNLKKRITAKKNFEKVY